VCALWIELEKGLSSINANIAAAILALVGVFFTVERNRREKRREQFHDLRRDIYLTAADTFASAIQYLALLSQPDVTRAQGTKLLQEISRVIAKIHVVATKEVLHAVTRLHAEYFKHYQALTRDKVALEKMLDEVAMNKSAIQHLLGIEDRSIPGLSPMDIIARTKDLEVVNIIHARNIEKLQWQMIDKWSECPAQLDPLISQAILSMKHELGIEIDADWYSKMSRESTSGFVDASRNALAEARRDFDARVAERDQRRREAKATPASH
jgi:hypothetical protein